MYLTRLVALALAGAFAVSACGDDGGTGNPGADAGPIADADVSEPDASEPEPDAMPEATELERLCAPNGAVVGLFRRGLECNEFFYFLRASFPDAFSPDAVSHMCTVMLGDYVADGTLALDEEVSEACLEWLQTGKCELIDTENGPPSAPGTPCDGLFVGVVDAGGSCEETFQCAGDAYCAEPVLRGRAEPCGQCTARKANGATCIDDDECSSRLCNASNVCAVPGDVGSSCTSDEDCRGLLTCDTDQGICKLYLPREGMSCVDHGDCGTPMLGLYCDLADTGTCKRLPQPGEPCLHDVGDVATMCDPVNYVWCSPVDDTCKEPEIVGEGEPCNFDATLGSGALKCDEGLACTDPDGTDEAGQPTGVCFRPGQEGDSCGLEADDSDQCDPLYECVSNVCTLQSDYSGMCPAPESP